MQGFLLSEIHYFQNSINKKSAAKIDRTFFLFQGILLYHFPNTQYTSL